MRVHVWVQPGAKTTEAAGHHGGDPKIRIAAKPEDGKANAELCAFLARALGVGKTEIQVVSGQTSRRKWLEIPDGSGARFEALFNSGGLQKH
jgi:uncharacterized protein